MDQLTNVFCCSWCLCPLPLKFVTNLQMFWICVGCWREPEVFFHCHIKLQTLNVLFIVMLLWMHSEVGCIKLPFFVPPQETWELPISLTNYTLVYHPKSKFMGLMSGNLCMTTLHSSATSFYLERNLELVLGLENFNAGWHSTHSHFWLTLHLYPLLILNHDSPRVNPVVTYFLMRGVSSLMPPCQVGQYLQVVSCLSFAAGFSARTFCTLNCTILLLLVWMGCLHFHTL